MNAKEFLLMLTADNETRAEKELHANIIDNFALVLEQNSEVNIEGNITTDEVYNKIKAYIDLNKKGNMGFVGDFEVCEKVIAPMLNLTYTRPSTALMRMLNGQSVKRRASTNLLDFFN